ncbi:MFS transporter [Arthrobacter sp. A5]|uniref:MFS transporter n=1 Tax=Arthrobacter sp. A5 TaxID=576926 RepID=UPI003DA7A825
MAGIVVDGMLITLTAYAQLSLKWSAIEFGLVTTVMTVTSIVGGMCAQRIVRRIRLRNLAALGMGLLAVACLSLAAISSTGLDWLLVPALFVFGAGLGGAMVGSQISALTGVLETQSGVASGLFDTSFSIGSALGVAICSSVAVASGNLTPANPMSGAALAFAVAATLAASGIPVSLTLLRERSKRA